MTSIDEAETAVADPAFGVRFANKKIFEENAGLNVLAIKKLKDGQ